MGPQHRSGVCFDLLPRKGFLQGLVATGLPELTREKSVAGNGQGSQFFPPLHHDLRKGKRRVPYFWGCDFSFYSLSALSSSGGLPISCLPPSFSGLRKEHSSFFPEFQMVSVICKLNIFKGEKNQNQKKKLVVLMYFDRPK